MLKRVTHIVLSFLLLISTTGMVVSKHYCSGELVSVSLYENDKSCCEMGNCCENEMHVYQVKEKFSVPAISTVPVSAELDVLGQDLFVLIGLVIPETETDVILFDESPPVLPTQKALALKQVFLL